MSVLIELGYSMINEILEGDLICCKNHEKKMVTTRYNTHLPDYHPVQKIGWHVLASEQTPPERLTMQCIKIAVENIFELYSKMFKVSARSNISLMPYLSY